MIAVPLTSMLKTTRSSKVSTPRTLKANVDQVVDGGGDRLVESENSKSIGCTEKPNFETPLVSQLQIFTMEFRSLLFYEDDSD